MVVVLDLSLYSFSLLSHFSIEGEFVPKEGDRVTFRTCPLPPKNVEQQAVMVVLTELKGAHEKWWNNSELK